MHGAAADIHHQDRAVARQAEAVAESHGQRFVDKTHTAHRAGEGFVAAPPGSFKSRDGAATTMSRTLFPVMRLISQRSSAGRRARSVARQRPAPQAAQLRPASVPSAA